MSVKTDSVCQNDSIGYRKNFGTAFDVDTLIIKNSENMNLLENKEVLRNLLYQGDQLNTLAGGVAKIDFNIENQADGFLIKLRAPGIEAEQLKVISDKNSLQVFATLNHPSENHGVMIPLFYRKVELPLFASTDEVDAIYHENELEIFIPIGKNSSGNKKEIEIKQL